MSKITHWENTLVLGISKAFVPKKNIYFFNSIECCINDDISEALMTTCFEYNITPEITFEILKNVVDAKGRNKRTKKDALRLSESISVIIDFLETHFNKEIKKHFVKQLEESF